MQHIKEILKKLGKNIQESNAPHQALLRNKLIAEHASAAVPTRSSFSWMPKLAFGVGALVFVVAGNSAYQSFSGYNRHDVTLSSAGVYSYAETGYEDMQELGANADSRSMYDDEIAYDLRKKPESDADIIAYEDEYGALMQQSVLVGIRTQEKEAPETVMQLFSSLGGYVSSFRITTDIYATVSGSIPAEQIAFFYEQLDTLVKNDAFIEKHMQGDSLTQSLVSIEKREEARSIAEAEIRETWESATEKERVALQKTLDALEENRKALEEEKSALIDQGEYVTVSVNIETLPTLLHVQDKDELIKVISGYQEQPTIFERAMINALSIFFVLVELVSATFWIILPLGGVWMWYVRRKKVLRELE